MYVTHTNRSKELSSLKAFVKLNTMSQDFQVWENIFKFNWHRNLMPCQHKFTSLKTLKQKFHIGFILINRISLHDISIDIWDQ